MREKESSEQLPTIFTRKARCRDCYRCLRVCPVKAIQLRGGQATVIAERCLACGKCIRECPQGAKSFRRDTDKVRRWIAEGSRVAVSVAPSFAALYSEWESKRIASALRRLGFARVEETAVGAWKVAHRSVEGARESASAIEGAKGSSMPAGAVICSACPAVVRFVEIYRPKQAPMLADVVSPMLAHARLMRAEEEIDRVVFIGPCVAKKDEAQAAEDRPVDAVLTFLELQEWLEGAGVDLAKLEESGFDRDPEGAAAARLFALEGGLARTAGLDTDMLADRLLALSGVEDLVEALDALGEESEPLVLEPLFCSGGCINGPVVPNGSPSLLARRRRLLAWAGSASAGARDRPLGVGGDGVSVARAGSRRSSGLVRSPTEEEIERILAELGKASPEDRLDCGACGYDTCWDKAVAVFHGMAEREMCIPLMRRLAEQRTDRVIESSPNGIVILDDRLRIIHANPAFRSFFVCSDAVLGKPISYLMDPAPFDRVREQPSEKEELTVHHEAYQLVCRQIIYALPGEKQVVGIFVNLTATKESEHRLEKLRQQTMEQARELLEHQIGMAQKMAMFLGENTALGEELVHKLLQLAGADASARAPLPPNVPGESVGGGPSGKARGGFGGDGQGSSGPNGGYV